MTSLSSAPQVDRLWSQLIGLILERSVVPVVGPELLEIEDGVGPPRNFYTLVAEDLATRLGQAMPNSTGRLALNHIACAYLKAGGLPEDLYPDVKAVVEDLERRVEIPDALATLATIPFGLFVTTNFDSLLTRAIERSRPAWSGRVRHFEYSPVRTTDVDPRFDGGGPVIFHLFGRASSMPEYAVTEEDILEFMHALQSDGHRPEHLFRLLQQRSLLILGCGFPDWLARFFVRLVKRDRLITGGGKIDWVADSTSSNPDFVSFLEHFSRRTRYFQLGPLEFIQQLRERLPRDLEPSAPSQPIQKDLDRDLLPGAVFLSYASEDRAIVERIHAALDENGIDCWFDRKQLQAGDDWELKIIRNVAACALFLPIISRHTLIQKDRFFRHEWYHAFKRKIGFPVNFRFLFPIVIDDTAPNDPALPPEMTQPNWERLPNGNITPSFVALITQAFRDAQREYPAGVSR